MKLLIVVDYQKDFVDGTLGFDGAEKLETGIKNLVKKFLANGDKVYFTLDTHQDYYLETQEGRKLPVEHCIKGTEGWKLYGSLQEYENNPNVRKLEKNTFGAKSLMRALHEESVDFEEIHLVGLVSNICVISNAVIAKTECTEAEIVIHSALTASFDSDLHQKALDVMKGLQMTII